MLGRGTSQQHQQYPRGLPPRGYYASAMRYVREQASARDVVAAWREPGKESARAFIRNEWPRLYHTLLDLANTTPESGQHG